MWGAHTYHAQGAKTMRKETKDAIKKLHNFINIYANNATFADTVAGIKPLLPVLDSLQQVENCALHGGYIKDSKGQLVKDGDIIKVIYQRGHEMFCFAKWSEKALRWVAIGAIGKPFNEQERWPLYSDNIGGTFELVKSGDDMQLAHKLLLEQLAQCKLVLTTVYPDCWKVELVGNSERFTVCNGLKQLGEDLWVGFDWHNFEFALSLYHAYGTNELCARVYKVCGGDSGPSAQAYLQIVIR